MSYSSLGIVPLSLRHLKAVRCVSQYKSVSKAADYLNRSQTAITHAINDVESVLGFALFNRSSKGMSLTVFGDTLCRRIKRIEDEFDSARREIVRINAGQTIQRNNPVFNMDISYKRLAALLAVEETGSVSAAAKLLQLSDAAIYKSLNELESLLDCNLFENIPTELAPTQYCLLLVHHIRLAFAHLRHAIDEMARLNGVTSGSVSIGMLPYSRTMLLPRAITRLLESYPDLHISTREGTYIQLERSLMRGDLDLIVGATRPVERNKYLGSEVLFRDQLAVIARFDHALAYYEKLKPKMIENLSWVLPTKDTPARQLFESYLDKHKIKYPVDYVETSSLTTLRGLLLESDRVALLSAHQIYYESRQKLLRILPIDLKETVRPIGVITRRNASHSPGTILLLDYLRQVAGELQN